MGASVQCDAGASPAIDVGAPDGMVLPLREILTLYPAGEDRFMAPRSYDGGGRVFGGSALGQGLTAAQATAPGRRCHSIHATFLRAGKVGVPILYAVERVRDGASFATRLVRAEQEGKTIAMLTASFQTPGGPGPAHQDGPPGDVPLPETLPDNDLRGRPVGMQMRTPGDRSDGTRPLASCHRLWCRSIASLGEVSDDGGAMHRAALAFMSDFPMLPTILRRHSESRRPPELRYTSLDHAIWFHAPVDLAQWHLFDLRTTVAGEQRGFSRGSVYSKDGVLVASVAQEAMLRHASPPTA